MKYGITACAAALLGVVFTSGCQELSNIGTTTTTTSVQDRRYVPNEDATLQLRNALCARESGCENIGDNHRYANISACLEARGHDADRLVGRDVCPMGISAGSLATCTADVRALGCGPALGDIETVPSCRADDLCRGQLQRRNVTASTSIQR